MCEQNFFMYKFFMYLLVNDLTAFDAALVKSVCPDTHSRHEAKYSETCL